MQLGLGRQNRLRLKANQYALATGENLHIAGDIGVAQNNAGGGDMVGEATGNSTFMEFKIGLYRPGIDAQPKAGPVFIAGRREIIGPELLGNVKGDGGLQWDD